MTDTRSVSGDPISIRIISAEDTLPLRRSVLRPHLSHDECRHDGDTDDDTRHFGAFRSGDLVAVASVFRQPLPGTATADAWRLRGMAVQQDARSLGTGDRLLRTIITHVDSHGCNLLWCYARTSAVGFYERRLFVKNSDEFDFDHVGPVVLMCRRDGNIVTDQA